MNRLAFGCPGRLLRLVWLAGLVCIHPASAQSPPLSQAPDFFAGEWTGTGPQGSYCYMALRPDGSGHVMVNGGAGDWMGAGIRWQNQRESLRVTQLTPWPVKPRLRTMALASFVLQSGFNQSLRLQWRAPDQACELQRQTQSERQLERARVLREHPELTTAAP